MDKGREYSAMALRINASKLALRSANGTRGMTGFEIVVLLSMSVGRTSAAEILLDSNFLKIENNLQLVILEADSSFCAVVDVHEQA